MAHPRHLCSEIRLSPVSWRAAAERTAARLRH